MNLNSIYETVENHRLLLACAFTSVVGIAIIKRFVSRGTKCSKTRMHSKTVLITGANTGIGKEAAMELARRGARVLLACRNVSKAEDAAAEIRKTTGNNNVEVYELDLASLKSVRKCAQEVLARESRLDVLINNAGVMLCPDWKTEDGFEMQIGTNHFGHFLLTNLLLDLLKQSAPSRIIVVSSGAHKAGKIDFEDINFKNRAYSSFGAYGQSKLANNLFSRELSKRLGGTGVTMNSLNPGVVDTELARHLLNQGSIKSKIFSVVYFLTKPIFMKSPAQGAQTTVHLAVAEELEGVTGKYFSDCAPAKESKAAYNTEDATRLWELSEKMVELTKD